jgi:hypothetical protein
MSQRNFTCIHKIVILFLFSFCLFLPEAATAADKRILLLPLKLYADPSKSYLSQGIQRILVSRLSGEGLRVVSDAEVEPLLTDAERGGITETSRAEALAKAVQADYALFGSITAVGAGYSLDVSLLEVREDGSKETRVSEAVKEDAFIPRMADVAYQLRAVIEGRVVPARTVQPQKPAPAGVEAEAETETAKGLLSKLTGEGEATPVTERGLFYQSQPAQRFEPTGRISVGTTVMAMDTGDVDGAGEAELVVVSRDKLMLYQQQETSYVLRETLEAGMGETFLKVSVGDADNDGRAEIYLVSQYGDRARSTVYDWAGGFKRRDRQSGHLLVIKDGAGPAQLLFQDSKTNAFFSGNIYTVELNSEGEVAGKEVLPTPKDVQFYTVVRHQLNKGGAPMWLGLGEPGLSEQAEILMWDSQGKVLWRGGGDLGGTNNAIRVGQAPPGEIPSRISFNPRLVITDVDGDGQQDLLAVRNIPLIDKMQDFKVYTKAKLTGFTLEGAALVPAWSTPEISYCVSDLQADGGTLFLAAHKGQVANVLTRERGYVMWFQ